MGLRLSDLAGRWAGETVYVVGSSAAWDHLDPRFFDDKRTIAINFVGPHFGLAETAIAVSQYGQQPDRIRAMGWKGLIVAPNRIIYNGGATDAQYESDDTTVRFVPPPTVDFVPFLKHWTDEPEHLFVGTTSLHAGMHLAYRMGAGTIVTVAADHGWWNGKTNGNEYPGASAGDQTDQLIKGHWPEHTDIMAAHLRGLGCNVYSMVPAVNLNLETLKFQGPRARIGL
jgi:hypothetical protein